MCWPLSMNHTFRKQSFAKKTTNFRPFCFHFLFLPSKSPHKLLLRALKKCTMEKKWICAFLNTWRIKTSCSVDIQRYLNQRRLTSWIPIGLGRVNMFILGLWYLEGRLLLNRSSLGQSNLFYSKCHFYLVFSFFTDSLILFLCFVLLDPSVHILSNVQVMLFSLTIFCLLTCSQGNAQ